MGLNANMSSVFSWNTKQIFLFLQVRRWWPHSSVVRGRRDGLHSGRAADTLFKALCRVVDPAIQLGGGGGAQAACVAADDSLDALAFLQAEYESEGSTRNQVSLWDRIIERPEDAVLNLPHVRNKYRLIDKGADLRGRAFNLTLTWNVMNKVGGTYFDSVTSSGHTLPTEYDAAPGAPRQRGGGMGARARRGHAGVRI